jgi:adenylate cyclase
MGKETERRYLVASDEWRAKAGKGVHIQQGYLSTDPERNVRIRVADEQAFITVKGKPSGVSRAEYEYAIPMPDARKLLDELCIKPIIEKTRYTIRLNGFEWEIDEYAKENEGLCVAEVEFNGKAPSSKPRWAGKEISGDETYSNINLVAHPFSEWRATQTKESAKFHLKHGESVAEGMSRILAEQLNIAREELSACPRNIGTSIHEARKAIKKTRSTLRLLRPMLPSLYQQENRQLRDLGRRLSDLRDAQVLIDVLSDLRKRYQNKLDKVDLSAVECELARRKEDVAKSVGSPAEFAQFTDLLSQVQERLKDADLGPADAAGLTASFGETVRRARKASRIAFEECTPEAFHEWRKRTKDLRYQLELLHKLWPDVLEAFANSAKSLEQRLGDHHNLTVLSQVLSQALSAMPDGPDRTKVTRTLLQVIDEDRQRLQDEAHTCGRLLLAEKPKIWRKRIDRGWASWREQS